MTVSVDLGDLEDPQIRTFEARGNIELLRRTLRSGETLLVVATASDRPLRGGLLALTSERILFVRERLIAKPRVLSLEFDEITDVSIDDRVIAGALSIAARGRNFRFGIVIPKMRTWNLFWGIKKRLEEREGRPTH